MGSDIESAAEGLRRVGVAETFALSGLLEASAISARADNWLEVLPPGIRKALVDAISAVEGGSVPTGLPLHDLEAFRGWEQCGVLYWWPTEWNVATGEWVVELKSMQIPNEAKSVSDFRMDPVSAYSILESVSVECVRLRGDLAVMPFVFFGTWHTHPSGAVEASPQDILAEVSFGEWRGAMGSFPLGLPRSFLFALEGRRVASVLAYNAFGPLKSWTSS